MRAVILAAVAAALALAAGGAAQAYAQAGDGPVATVTLERATTNLGSSDLTVTPLVSEPLDIRLHGPDGRHILTMTGITDETTFNTRNAIGGNDLRVQVDTQGGDDQWARDSTYTAFFQQPDGPLRVHDGTHTVYTVRTTDSPSTTRNRLTALGPTGTGYDGNIVEFEAGVHDDLGRMVANRALTFRAAPGAEAVITGESGIHLFNRDSAVRNLVFRDIDRQVLDLLRSPADGITGAENIDLTGVITLAYHRIAGSSYQSNNIGAYVGDLSNVEITGNVFNNTYAHAIVHRPHFDVTHSYDYTGVTVSGNQFIGIGANGDQDWPAAISTPDRLNVDLGYVDYLVADNIVRGTKGPAFYFDEAAGVTLMNNDISGAGEEAIAVGDDGTTSLVIRGNTISSAYQSATGSPPDDVPAAIRLPAGGAGMAVEGNDVSDSGVGVLVCEGACALPAGGTFYADAAGRLADADACVVGEESCAAATSAASRATATELGAGNGVAENSFVRMAHYSVANLAAGTLNATRNYHGEGGAAFGGISAPLWYADAARTDRQPPEPPSVVGAESGVLFLPQVDEGTVVRHQIQATDPDTPSDRLTFALREAYPRAAMTEGGLFTWETVEADGRQATHAHEFLASVSDGTTAVDFTINVIVDEVNMAPAITVSELRDPYRAAVGEEFRLVLNATDPDGPHSTDFFWSIDGNRYGSRISAASGDSSMGVLTWEPAAAHDGLTLAITPTVSDQDTDNELEDAVTLNILVHDPISLGALEDQTASAGLPVEYDLPLTNPDGVPVEWSIESGARGDAAVDAAGRFTWNTGAEDTAQEPHEFTVRASVVNGTDYDEGVLRVDVSSIGMVFAETVEGTSASFVAAMDEPGSYRWYLVDAPAAGSPDMARSGAQSRGAFEWPADAGPGGYVSFSTDGAQNDLAEGASYAVKVNGTAEGASYAMFATEAAGTFVRHLPGLASVDSVGETSIGLTLLFKESGAHMVAPAADGAGEADTALAVTVTSAGFGATAPAALEGLEPGTAYRAYVRPPSAAGWDGRDVARPFAAATDPVPQPEVLRASPAGGSVEFEIGGTGRTVQARMAHPWGGPFGAESAPGATTVLSASGLVDGADYFVQARTEPHGWDTKHTAHFRYTHPDAASVQRLQGHDPPAITTAPRGHLASVGEEFPLDITVTDGDPADTVSLSVAGPDPGVSISEPVRSGTVHTARLTWTPAASDVGAHQVTVVATDSERQTGNATLHIEVRPPSDTLYVLDAAPPAVDEREPVSHPLVFNSPSGAPLTWEVTSGPAGHRATADGGTFEWTPGEADGGATHEFVVTLGDGAGTDPATVSVEVRETNEPPSFRTGPGPHAATVGTPFALDLRVSDPDIPAQAVACSVVSGNATGGPQVAAPACAVAWDPQEAGTHVLLVRATDDAPEPASADLEVTITARPPLPPGPVPDAPDAVVGTVAGRQVSFAPDPSATPAPITGVTNGTRGDATHNGTHITYDPAPGQVGRDSLTYTVVGRTGIEATGAVSVVITPDVGEADATLLPTDTAASIRAAIEGASDGDVIVFEAGTYHNLGDVPIPAAVTLAPAPGAVATLAGEVALHVLSDGVRITGLGFSGANITQLPPPGGYNGFAPAASAGRTGVISLAYDAAAWPVTSQAGAGASLDGVDLSHNSFDGTLSHAVVFRPYGPSHEVAYSDITVAGNSFRGIGEGAAAGAPSPLGASGTAGMSVDGLSVEGNTVEGHAGPVLLANVRNGSFAGNAVSGSESGGVRVVGADGLAITGNSLSGAGRAAVELDPAGTSGVSVSRNEMSAYDTGVLVCADPCRLPDDFFTRGSKYSPGRVTTADASVCYSWRCVLGGDVEPADAPGPASASDLSVTENTFARIGHYSVATLADGALNARRNHHGGAGVFGDASIEPWYVDPGRQSTSAFGAGALPGSSPATTVIPRHDLCGAGVDIPVIQLPGARWGAVSEPATQTIYADGNWDVTGVMLTATDWVAGDGSAQPGAFTEARAAGEGAWRRVSPGSSPVFGADLQAFAPGDALSVEIRINLEAAASGPASLSQSVSYAVTCN